MEPKHAVALGSTATATVALIIKFWVNALLAWKAPPPMDDQTALAHAAIVVWAVAAFAMARGWKLPSFSRPRPVPVAPPDPVPAPMP